MIKTYNINYPCKVISSFYDNYFGVHKYDLIKKITLRNSLPKSNEEDDVLKLFIFFQLFFAVHQDEIKQKIFTFFDFVFKSKPTNVTTTISNKNIVPKLLRSFKYEIQLL